MARKRSEIQQQMAALQAELDDADTDDEVWIKEGNREIRVTGRRATTILGRYADLTGEGQAEDEGQAEEDEEGQAEDEGQAGGYFSRKRR